MNVQRYPLLLLVGAVIVGVIAAIAFGVMRAPMSDLRGTAPSSVTGAPCEGVPEGDRQRCLEAYRAPPQTGATGAATEPREGTGRGAAAGSARGSGVEGVTSGGTTSTPGGNR